MSASKPRRLAVWLIVAVALVAGGPLAWWLRPLTADEQALLGTWQREIVDSATGQAEIYDLTFRANHRWAIRKLDDGKPGPNLATGDWSAVPGELSTVTDLSVPITWRAPFAYFENFFRKSQRRRCIALVFQNADTFSLTSPADMGLMIWKRCGN